MLFYGSAFSSSSSTPSSTSEASLSMKGHFFPGLVVIFITISEIVEIDNVRRVVIINIFIIGARYKTGINGAREKSKKKFEGTLRLMQSEKCLRAYSNLQQTKVMSNRLQRHFLPVHDSVKLMKLWGEFHIHHHPQELPWFLFAHCVHVGHLNNIKR